MGLRMVVPRKDKRALHRREYDGAMRMRNLLANGEEDMRDLMDMHLRLRDPKSNHVLAEFWYNMREHTVTIKTPSSDKHHTVGASQARAKLQEISGTEWYRIDCALQRQIDINDVPQLRKAAKRAAQKPGRFQTLYEVMRMTDEENDPANISEDDEDILNLSIISCVEFERSQLDTTVKCLDHFAVYVPNGMDTGNFSPDIMDTIKGYQLFLRSRDFTWMRNNRGPIMLEFREEGQVTRLGTTLHERLAIWENGYPMPYSNSSLGPYEFVERMLNSKQLALVKATLDSARIATYPFYTLWQKACREKDPCKRLELTLGMVNHLREWVDPGEAILLPLQETAQCDEAAGLLAHMAFDTEVRLIGFKVREARTAF